MCHNIRYFSSFDSLTNCLFPNKSEKRYFHGSALIKKSKHRWDTCVVCETPPPHKDGTRPMFICSLVQNTECLPVVPVNHKKKTCADKKQFPSLLWFWLSYPVKKRKSVFGKHVQGTVHTPSHFVYCLSLLVCLKGFKTHGKCYLADPVKKRYHTASEDCNSLGGVLGTPMSSGENDKLREYIHQSVGPDEQVWLGVNDMMTEGTWTDQHGVSITFKNWDTTNYRSPQPDGGVSQNCVVLSGSASGKWFDENCREEKASVCQFNIV